MCQFAMIAAVAAVAAIWSSAFAQDSMNDPTIPQAEAPYKTGQAPKVPMVIANAGQRPARRPEGPPATGRGRHKTG
jgi:hypothetical protein